jgi:antitoxin component YwqK of YwqJK toxin-antitoxin module
MLLAKSIVLCTKNIDSADNFGYYKLHREDGPAIVAFYNNGNVWYEKYFENGHLHRVDGPAEVSYYDTGVKATELYCQKGHMHREDGPSKTYFTDGNSETILCYAIDGTDYTVSAYRLYLLMREDFNSLKETY